MNSGQNANKQGSNLEDLAELMLKEYDYQYIPANKFNVACNGLEQKFYTYDYPICDSVFSTDLYKHPLKADLVLFNPSKKEKYIVIECKSQSVAGSTDEKLYFLNANIKEKYPYKAIVILDMPKAEKSAVHWFSLQPQHNPNLLHVFQSFSEFRHWAIKNL